MVAPMYAFFLRRIGSLVVALFVASIAVFLLVRAVPGDPACANGVCVYLVSSRWPGLRCADGMCHSVDEILGAEGRDPERRHGRGWDPLSDCGRAPRNQHTR